MVDSGIGEREFFFVEISGEGGSRIWKGGADRLSFMERMAGLAERWEVEVLAFRLSRSRATMVLRGPRRGVSEFRRLLQSGHGVLFYYQGGFLCWDAPVMVPLADEEHALDVATGLHLVDSSPLRNPYSSLRDLLGLRQASWYSPSWLLERLPLREHLEIAGLQGLQLPTASLFRLERQRNEGIAVSWGEFGRALEHTTGRPGNSRPMRRARVQLAHRFGWSTVEIAEALGVQRQAIRRSLRHYLGATIDLAAFHLQNSWLREGITSVDAMDDSC